MICKAHEYEIVNLAGCSNLARRHPRAVAAEYEHSTVFEVAIKMRASSHRRLQGGA